MTRVIRLRATVRSIILVEVLYEWVIPWMRAMTRIAWVYLVLDCRHYLDFAVRLAPAQGLEADPSPSVLSLDKGILGPDTQ